MTIKQLATALVATAITTPAFAHAGDHSSVQQGSFLQHLTQSPFHILGLATIAIAAGLLVWRIRDNRTVRQHAKAVKSSKS